MPNMDKTGPNGQGPMTGRGAGNCSPDNQERGFLPRCRRLFLGRGRRAGRGRGGNRLNQ